MFELFLKGIFMEPLLGILMIFMPERLYSNSFRQIIWGTSPRLKMGKVKGVRSSTCSSREPDISVDTSSSGMLALTKRFMGSLSLRGISIS